jgi:hypothetical protein
LADPGVVIELLEHPKPLVVVLLLLVLIALALWFGRYTDKQDQPTGYIGSQVHRVSMEATIETIVVRMLERFPQADDGRIAQLVRDELATHKMKNVELYEGTIFTIIARMRGGGGGQGEVDRWTD